MCAHLYMPLGQSASIRVCINFLLSQEQCSVVQVKSAYLSLGKVNVRRILTMPTSAELIVFKYNVTSYT